ncbi:hypothetical protein [Mesorhizobium sp. M0898]|uniref:hypothetical protein n=1 Tax=Mesorhizobium sp. M0898 TaxID=2957020 RepID=UPI003339B0D7
MSQFLTPPLFQTLDASANPRVGAKLSIFQTATTTLLSLFSDEALTTPIANPMISDSAGVFPLCFIAETKFKATLTTSADVLVYSRDPVYSTGQADNILAEDVSFDGSGIGFSSTNVQDAIVELYGSVAHLTGADFTGDLSTTGDVSFKGTDSASNVTTYAGLAKTVIDNTDASEDGELSVKTMVAGTYANRLNIAQGVWTPGATGGDKGVNTLNVTAVYVNGARLGGAPDAVFVDQKTTGTGGGTFTLGAWRTRDLNTKLLDPGSLITVSANTFVSTIAGWVEWSAPAKGVQGNKTRLYNVTDSTVAGVGSTAWNDTSPDSGSLSVGSCAVVAGKTYRLEHQSSSTRADGFGVASGFSEVEIYTRISFWRTA